MGETVLFAITIANIAIIKFIVTIINFKTLLDLLNAV